jgi:lipopolysaccharide export system permease protein
LLTVDRYLLREFALSVAAATVVLLFVAFGGVIADLLGEIANGKVPVVLLISQVGLRSVRSLPLVLPLALFLGLMLCIGRLYRDSEMAVLASFGRGPRDAVRPLLLLTVPAVLLIAVSSLWAGPWADRTAREMVATANRSLLVAGLEAGRFRELPGGQGMLYVGALSPDGSEMQSIFVQSENRGKLDVVTAKRGVLYLDGSGGRYLRLYDGMRVEGVPGHKDYRMMHYRRNDIRLPDQITADTQQDATTASTLRLLTNARPDARAELHWRFSAPIAAFLLALLALPLGRAEPRQPRYGRILVALGIYLNYMVLMLFGRGLLSNLKIPGWLGLWWLHLPVLALALWLLWRDGHLRAPKAGAGVRKQPA